MTRQSGSQETSVGKLGWSGRMQTFFSEDATRKLLLTGAIILAILTAAGALMYPQIRRLMWPYLDREIGANVTIGPQWQEIIPAQPLVDDRERQEIILWVGAPVRPSVYPLACLLPDGSYVVPEVELVSESGKTYKLVTYGETVYPGIHDHFEATLYNLDLPRGKTYRAVRIRCDREIPVKKIVWRCYNPWDV